MENFSFTMGVVFPLIFYMLVGYACKLRGLINKDLALKINSLVFSLFMPMSLFLSSSRSFEIRRELVGVIAFTLSGMLLVFFISWFFYSRWVTEDKYLGSLIQSSYRTNLGLFGSALTYALLQGKGTGIIEVLVAVYIPLANVLSIFILQYYGSTKTSMKDTLVHVLKNPLIDAVLLGLVFSLLNIKIPDLLYGPMKSIANIGTPLALISLGAIFSFEATKKIFKVLVVSTIGRLVIVPLCMLSLAVLIGYRGETLVALLAVFASPVAVVTYSMSSSMGQDEELAGQILIFTSIFCAFSLFFFIYVLKSLQLI